MPLQLSLTFQAVLWFQLIRVFREGEERFIRQGGSIDQSDEDHLEALDALINQGVDICDGLQRCGIPSGAKFTLDDLQAAIDGLRDTKSAVHFPRCTPETAAALDNLFACA